MSERSEDEGAVRAYTVRLTDAEIAAVREMTRVDQASTALRAVVREAVERNEAARARIEGKATGRA